MTISRDSARSTNFRGLSPRTQGQGMAHLESILGHDPFSGSGCSFSGNSPRFTQGGKLRGEGSAALITLQQLLRTQRQRAEVCSEEARGALGSPTWAPSQDREEREKAKRTLKAGANPIPSPSYKSVKINSPAQSTLLFLSNLCRRF